MPKAVADIVAGISTVFKPRATDKTAITVKGLASQTGNLQEWQDSTTAVLTAFSSIGRLVSPGYTATAPTAGTIISISRAHASQTASTFEVQNSSSAVLSRFDKGGYFMTRKTAAPADGDIATGEMALWFDSTNGAAKLMVKAKQADGTVRTGNLALA